jgi:DNA-binding GntR family transcriptional regulator
MIKLAGIDRAATQADQAYEALLAEILDCRLAPGAKITISDVAARLQMSPGAVREALSRLSAEKWTIAAAQKGYSVAPVSIADLKDLTRTRIAIEQMCLRSAIAHGDVEWETSIVAAYHRLHRIPIVVADTASRLNDGWVAAHTTFHAVLASGCDSPGCSICGCSMPRASVTGISPSRWPKIAMSMRAQRHSDACLTRDAELAYQLRGHHLQRTRRIFW